MYGGPVEVNALGTPRSCDDSAAASFQPSAAAPSDTAAAASCQPVAVAHQPLDIEQLPVASELAVPQDAPWDLKLPETSMGHLLSEADQQLARALAVPRKPLSDELQDLRWRMILLILREGGGVRLGDVGAKDSGCLGAADTWALNNKKSRKRATLIRAIKAADDGVFELLHVPETNPLITLSSQPMRVFQ